jgi:galactoside O-acetyltransferase
MEPGEFAEAGGDVKIYPLAKILGAETIRIGSHVIIDDFVFIGHHRQLIIGNHVHIASHTSITGGGLCILCDFSGLSSGVRIVTGSDDFGGGGLTNPTIPARYRAVERGRIVIGAHAIIGSNAVVFPNVTIGEGAAVSAGSVVNKNLDPWSIYAGAPARRVSARPREKILEAEAKLAMEENLDRRFRTAEALDAFSPV